MDDITLAGIMGIVADSSLVATFVSFIIYLIKKKRKSLTEARKDILQDVQNLILAIKKISYSEKEELLELMTQTVSPYILSSLLVSVINIDGLCALRKESLKRL